LINCSISLHLIHIQTQNRYVLVKNHNISSSSYT
jgi:hypothetical protein